MRVVYWCQVYNKSNTEMFEMLAAATACLFACLPACLLEPWSSVSGGGAGKPLLP